MNTAKSKAGATATGGAAPQKKEVKNLLKDSKNGAEVAATVLKTEQPAADTRAVADIIEAIQRKIKLVSNLSATKERRQKLQHLHAEDKIAVSIHLASDKYKGTVVEFTNEDIVDAIFNMLVEKSKDVEADIIQELRELEK